MGSDERAIREVDAGSCNGCELEIHALNNAFYDLERFGLRFVASPRHADVLMVTGPVTRHMREALERTWRATPDPMRWAWSRSSVQPVQPVAHRARPVKPARQARKLDTDRKGQAAQRQRHLEAGAVDLVVADEHRLAATERGLGHKALDRLAFVKAVELELEDGMSGD